MDVLRQLIDDARAVMADMSTTQRVAVATLVATVASLLVFAVYMGSNENEAGVVPLPLDIQPAQANEILDRLNQAGLGPAEFRADLKVYVPLAKSKDAWIYLAREDLLPKDASAGFNEMLEKWNFSTTDRKAGEMMNVARGAEVAKLLECIDVVQGAKVVYSGSARSGPFRPEKKRRAAVTIRTRMGKELTDDVANTIINLVSAAEAGMDVKDVMVTDQAGRHFRAQDTGDMAQMSLKSHRIELQRNREYEDRIEKLCRQVVPGSEAWAFVDVEMDWNSKELWKRDYEEGVPSRVDQEKEKRVGTKEPAAEVGTRPNLGRASEVSGTGTTEMNSYERKTTGRSMQNDETQTWEKQAPYVKRKTISAIVQMPYVYKRGYQDENGVWVYADKKADGTLADWVPENDSKGNAIFDAEGNPMRRRFAGPALAAAERQNLKRLIAKAAGLGSDVAEDAIEILDVAYPEEKEFAKAPPGATLQVIQRIRDKVVPIMMLVLLFACVFFIYLQAKRALPAEEFELPEDQTVAMEMLMPATEADQDQAQFEALRTKIADAVAENPAKAAGLVRRWMTKENY